MAWRSLIYTKGIDLIVRNSNNAIKFLLAQYRAIFKRAYVKGLAAAVLLTAGLAAGQAQATPEYHFWDYKSAWTTKTDATASGGLVADVIGGNNVKNHTETLVTGGRLTIGGTDTSAISSVTSGSAVAGWASAESEDITVRDNIVTITASGTVNKDNVDGRGFIYGGWAQSLAGKATVEDSHIIVKGKTDNKAAASDGLIGAYVEGHSGATATGNTAEVTGTDTTKQILSTSGTSTAIGATIMPITAGSDPNKVSGSGVFTANQNQVILDNVSATTTTNTQVVNFFGAHFSGLTNADATKTTLKATSNSISLKNATIDTASGSTGNILGATHDGIFAGTVSFNENQVDIKETTFTASGSMSILGANINGTGKITASGNSILLDAVNFESKVAAGSAKGNVAGAVIQGTSQDITATGNSAQVSGASTLNVDAVAGAYINNTNNSAKVNLTVTGNSLEIGTGASVTASHVAGAVIAVSGAQLSSLNASNNSVSVAGSVTGDIKTVVFSPVDGSVANGANLSFLNNDLTLESGAKVTSGSLIGGAGKDSVLTIKDGSTYTVSQADKDISSDVINIAGDIAVQESASLNIGGFYGNGYNAAAGYNENMTTVADSAEIVNSGTINVFGKMVVDERATLTAGKANAAIIVNGSKEFKSSTELSADQKVEGASHGHLAIYAKTLQGYLEGQNSGTVVLSGATLEFSDDEVNLSDFNFSGDSGAGHIGIKSASIILGQDVIISDVLANSDNSTKLSGDTSNLSIEAAGTLTLGSKTLDSTSAVDFGFDSAKAQNLDVQASGGTLILANDVTLESYTDTEGNFVAGRGSITGNLTLSGGSLNINYGNYTDNNLLNVQSGTLSVGGDAGNIVDANGNLVNASLDLNSLTVGANGKTYVNANAVLNVTKLDASAAGKDALYVHSNAEMTVEGAITTTTTPGQNGQPDTTTTDYGVKFNTNSVSIGAGGTLTLGEAATSAIKVSTTADPDAAAGENKYVTVDQTAFKGKVFTVAAGGTVAFSFGTEEQNQVFTTDAINEFRSTLFNDIGATNTIKGFIDLGHAEIQGLKIDPNSSTVDWDNLAGYADIIADITTADLKQATVTGVAANDEVRGNVGAIATDAGVTDAQIVGNTTLNNAAGNGGKFVADANGNVGGLQVTETSTVVLNNGGEIKDITFAKAGTLMVNSVAATTDSTGATQAGTTIANIDAEAAEVVFDRVSDAQVGNTVVTGTTDVAKLTTAAGTETTFTKEVTVGANTTGSTLVDFTSTLAGTTTFKDDATFAQDAELTGTTTFEQDANFSGDALITGTVTATKLATATTPTEVTFEKDATIAAEGTLVADNVTMTAAAQGTAPFTFNVGVDTTNAAATDPSGTGYLEVAKFTLAGNDLVVDPAYDEKTSIAAIRGFGDTANNQVDAGTSGTVDGRIFVGMNAALDVGVDASIDHMAKFIKQYQNAAGSLDRDNVGAVMYLSDVLTVSNDSRVILDSQRGASDILTQANLGATGYGDGTTAADLYLGQNTVLAVGDGILEDGTAIHFESIDAAIMAQDDSAKIVLDGDKFLNSSSITLFTDEDASGQDGVRVLGTEDIRVETLNGVMYFTLEAGDTNAKGGTLTLDETKIDTAFTGATNESRNLLLAYASRTANWEEYYSKANQDLIAAKDPAAVDSDPLVAGVDSAAEAELDDQGKIQVNDSKLSADDFVIITEDDGQGGTRKVLYRKAHNTFLEAVARNTDGRALDSASLQGVFGGSAQAALLAAQTSQDAVAGRTGVGASSSALTFADNGQGAGLWINPIYVSQDSDGFAVDSKDYGVDIDLYGVALGGDYTLANGVRLGAFFNVGSGKADGNGQASNVSNDFNYWGLGLYAGYSVGAFSVVGDFSYSVVDSDVEANTQVGKLTSSYDTDNISVGVTGQYEFDISGTQITPHAGLRYSSLSIDDFDIVAAGYEDGGSFDTDRLNVFSIPVGVTIAKEFALDSWTVKPSFDLTLTGNFGDDEIDSSNRWDGVANWESNYSSEFIDNFTYGATLGVAAKTGNFSLGIGVGYTGSSNTDSFNATANARFTF